MVDSKVVESGMAEFSDDKDKDMKPDTIALPKDKDSWEMDYRLWDKTDKNIENLRQELIFQNLNHLKEYKREELSEKVDHLMAYIIIHNETDQISDEYNVNILKLKEPFDGISPNVKDNSLRINTDMPLSIYERFTNSATNMMDGLEDLYQKYKWILKEEDKPVADSPIDMMKKMYEDLKTHRSYTDVFYLTKSMPLISYIRKEKYENGVLLLDLNLLLSMTEAVDNYKDRENIYYIISGHTGRSHSEDFKIKFYDNPEQATRFNPKFPTVPKDLMEGKKEPPVIPGEKGLLERILNVFLKPKDTTKKDIGRMRGLK